MSKLKTTPAIVVLAAQVAELQKQLVALTKKHDEFVEGVNEARDEFMDQFDEVDASIQENSEKLKDCEVSLDNVEDRVLALEIRNDGPESEESDEE